jgi:hypothetical protein
METPCGRALGRASLRGLMIPRRAGPASPGQARARLRPRGLLALLAIATGFLLVAPPGALGHGPGRGAAPRIPTLTETVTGEEVAETPATPSTNGVGLPIPIALALGATALGALTAARSKRMTALALGGALLVLSVETGIHSVHHLLSPSDVARCGYATAASHLVGSLDVTDRAVATPPPAVTAAVTPTVEVASTRPRQPGSVRSPPSLSSPA